MQYIVHALKTRQREKSSPIYDCRLIDNTANNATILRRVSFGCPEVLIDGCELIVQFPSHYFSVEYNS